MRVMERKLQEITPGKEQQFLCLERAWEAVDERIGAPEKRYYVSCYGPQDKRVIVWEREFETYGAMQKCLDQEQSAPRPELQALGFNADDILEWHRRDVYWVLDLPLPRGGSQDLGHRVWRPVDAPRRVLRVCQPSTVGVAAGA